MIPDVTKAKAGAAIVFAPYSCAFARPAHDCGYVRQQVWEHGVIDACAWAIASGYSPKEIATIRKQCAV